MKIAIAVWDLSVSGGTQRQVVELATELAKRHQVAIYAHTFDPQACYPDLTSKLKISSVSNQLPKGRSYNSKSWLSKQMFDFHGQFHPVDEQEKALAALITTEYDVLNIHDYHVEQTAWEYKRRFPNSRVVWMVNDMPNTFQLRQNLRPKPRKNLYIFGLQLLLRAAVEWHANQELKRLKAVDTIVALGKKNQRTIGQAMKRPSIAVASGLDAKRFRPRFQKPKQIFTVLAVGILFAERRYDMLVQAVAQLKDHGHACRLLIVGSNKYNPGYATYLQDLAAELNVTESVQLLGSVSDDELTRLYRDSNVFALTSQTQTWGLAPFEAMASGTPVIINEEAGAADWLTPEKQALFIPPNDTGALVRQLERLITNPSLRRQLARDGRTYIEQNISWQRYAETMLNIFRDA